MLAYSKDEERTRMAYFSGLFHDKRKRSYIDNLGHEHLRGKDRSDRRALLFLEAKGIGTRCTGIDWLCTMRPDRKQAGFTCHAKQHNREPMWGSERAAQ